jgi:hypothetical protein
MRAVDGVNFAQSSRGSAPTDVTTILGLKVPGLYGKAIHENL